MYFLMFFVFYVTSFTTTKYISSRSHTLGGCSISSGFESGLSWQSCVSLPSGWSDIFSSKMVLLTYTPFVFCSLSWASSTSSAPAMFHANFNCILQWSYNISRPTHRETVQKRVRWAQTCHPASRHRLSGDGRRNTGTFTGRDNSIRDTQGSIRR